MKANAETQLFMLIENGAIRGEYYTKLADSVIATPYSRLPR